MRVRWGTPVAVLNSLRVRFTSLLRKILSRHPISDSEALLRSADRICSRLVPYTSSYSFVYSRPPTYTGFNSGYLAVESMSSESVQQLLVY
jgi:hypothetical protein